MQQPIDLALQGGQIADGGAPDLIEVDAEVTVDQHVPHTNGQRPRQGWCEVTNGLRNMRKRLAKNLKMVDDPCLNQLVRVKSGSTPRHVFLDALDGFDRILQPVPFSPQSGLASTKSRSLTLGLRPRDETTSTETPSRALRSSTS